MNIIYTIGYEIVNGEETFDENDDYYFLSMDDAEKYLKENGFSKNIENNWERTYSNYNYEIAYILEKELYYK